MDLPDPAREADLAVWFDPVCPFCWMTSKWIRLVQQRRPLVVEWRLISLRLLNADVDYDAHFPPEYEAGHVAGLRLLRVAAAVRRDRGWTALDDLQRAFGQFIFEVEPGEGEFRDERDVRVRARTVLAAAGLDESFVDALDDGSLDDVLRADTELALTTAGKDVGTPVIQFDPPSGPGFFGPVISRLPSPDQATELWDHVLGLARFGGFAELKRSLRELPQLRALGVSEDEVGVVEDWHGGSRRQKQDRG